MGGTELKLVLVRVDDRLIHGQVVLGWTRAVSANRIVVADNATANDSMQQTLLKMAAPSGVKVSILTTDEAGEQLSSSTFKGENVMVLVRGPEALLDLRTAGVEFSKVNVGNVRSAEGRKRITKEVHASPEELHAWKQLADQGITLEAQWVPDQRKTRLNDKFAKQG
jgi:mannose/fructose/N-acetylgalactosamine-specific phosphotransferase system component IIB